MVESTFFMLLSLFSILNLLCTLLLYLFHCYSLNISLTNRPIGPSTRCTSNHVLQHCSCRGIFIAYETCFRWIFINHFSPEFQFNMTVLKYQPLAFKVVHLLTTFLSTRQSSCLEILILLSKSIASFNSCKKRKLCT